jgi:hypothetical protein
MLPESRFATSLPIRRANAAWHAKRYRSDPEYRLKRINRARAVQGPSPRASLDEARLRLPMDNDDAQ